jgi:hypothetical protein
MIFSKSGNKSVYFFAMLNKRRNDSVLKGIFADE